MKLRPPNSLPLKVSFQSASNSELWWSEEVDAAGRALGVVARPMSRRPRAAAAAPKAAAAAEAAAALFAAAGGGAGDGAAAARAAAAAHHGAHHLAGRGRRG